MAKIIDNFILLETIAQGTFGEIHKGRNLISKDAVANFFVCKTLNQNAVFNKKFDSFLHQNFHYIAPELLIPSTNNNNDFSNDVFSLGVVLYEMLFGTLPFEKYANSKEDLISFYQNNNILNILQQDVKLLSEKMSFLITKMITLEPELRIQWQNINEIIQEQPQQLQSPPPHPTPPQQHQQIQEEDVLFDVSKELSAQTKSRKQLILAHFLADIACIDIMYTKFLGKKRLDTLNHPYFKKLNEISLDKLLENLENKFKLYEYHRNE
ncbi:protein kinase domain protein [Ichthyophthirius multifiliis]|uniref:Protein kinase domain protein n=1 Tax=Ichthyophthirius multifiliis TaxID=5932 RepID=G0R415_ICHMU|nr:protein kinase domain protein [Ichthyophthirius multifiliis]EGR27789.1 protein kinase domain protein [Ichthyophthirius multifiliis]|eukprot:XP_004027134.1 protein kinase domain protein [Ichthyophthirius multifiliis]